MVLNWIEIEGSGVAFASCDIICIVTSSRPHCNYPHDLGYIWSHNKTVSVHNWSQVATYPPPLSDESLLWGDLELELDVLHPGRVVLVLLRAVGAVQGPLLLRLRLKIYFVC